MVTFPTQKYTRALLSVLIEIPRERIWRQAVKIVAIPPPLRYAPRYSAGKFEMVAGILKIELIAVKRNGRSEKFW
jgi:hypothetical protein